MWLSAASDYISSKLNHREWGDRCWFRRQFCPNALFLLLIFSLFLLNAAMSSSNRAWFAMTPKSKAALRLTESTNEWKGPFEGHFSWARTAAKDQRTQAGSWLGLKQKDNTWVQQHPEDQLDLKEACTSTACPFGHYKPLPFTTAICLMEAHTLPTTNLVKSVRCDGILAISYHGCAVH